MTWMQVMICVEGSFCKMSSTRAMSNFSFSELYRQWLRYPLWRVAHPLSPYEQFYADIVLRRIARNIGHDAIGVSARPVRCATELLDIMLQYGLTREHRFVDYGCGSLRLGRAVVEYLNPEGFIGLDIASKFLDLGAQFLGDDLVREKRPSLAVINEDALQQVKDRRPDYIGSWHVCSKVPDRHLRRYFANILGLMAEGTQAFIQFPQTSQRRRLNHLNWTLSKLEFCDLIASIDSRTVVHFGELLPCNSVGVTEAYAKLTREKPDSARRMSGSEVGCLVNS